MTGNFVAVLALVLLGVTGQATGAATAGIDTVHVAPPTGERDADRASVLRALKQVEPGATVQFAAGTYLLGGEIIRITVPRLTLLGHPAGTILRGCDPAAIAREQGALELGARCNLLELAGARQTVRNLTFEHALLALHVGCCWEDFPFMERGEGGHLIEGNTFRSTSNAVRVHGAWTEPSIIRDNRFRNNWHSVAIYGNTVHLLDNDISALEPEQVPGFEFPWDAVGIGPSMPIKGSVETAAGSCANNVVARNRIEGNADGIMIDTGRPGDSCRNNVVRDNTIIVSRVRAPARLVEEWGLSEPTFIGTPIALLNYAEAFRSAGFTWTGEEWSRSAGSDGDNPVAEESFLEDNVIEGNRIIGAEGLGMEILYASRNRIANNTFTAIVPRDPFPGNFFGPRPEMDVPLEWGGANGAGIWLSPGSDENEVVANTFEDIAGHAIVIEGDRNRVETRGAGDAVRDVGSGNRVLRAGRPAAQLEALYRARTDSARRRFSAADVRFMSGMIAHHAQAIVMAGLAASRDASPAVRLLAERISNAQEDEIALLQQWLRERGQPVPEVDLTLATHTAHGAAHAAHAHGMLTAAELRALAAATAREFDRLFLEYMIRHHIGAIAMVDELFGTDAAAQDPGVSGLAAAIQADQTAEIVRMRRMLAELALTGRIR